MPALKIGPIGLAGVELETWLLKFDKFGTCVSPQTRAALLARLGTNPKQPVILFSHGWNNEFADARSLYTSFLTEIQKHLHTYGTVSVPPLFVGVIWPSTWLSFDTGPQIGAAPGPAGGDSDGVFARELAGELDDPAQREELLGLLRMRQIQGRDAQRLAQLTAQALRCGPRAAAADTADTVADGADSLLSGAQALGELDGTVHSSCQQFEEGGTIDDALPTGPRQAGLLSLIDPRKLLQVASVYQMKDRAGTVGAAGIAALLHDILGGGTTSLHMVGHSFGAKVILSAIAAADLPYGRKVTSALLLQPAISHLCFAVDAVGAYGRGGYRGVPEKISQSLLMTYSSHDFPLHVAFHRALRRRVDVGEPMVGGAAATDAGEPPDIFAALGGYGPRAANQMLVQPFPEPGTAIELPRGVVPMAFDGTRFKRVASHGDVVTPYTAWLLHVQMARQGGSDDARR